MNSGPHALGWGLIFIGGGGALVSAGVGHGFELAARHHLVDPPPATGLVISGLGAAMSGVGLMMNFGEFRVGEVGPVLLGTGLLVTTGGLALQFGQDDRALQVALVPTGNGVALAGQF